METNLKKTYRVEGMSCKHCQARVEKALESLDGVVAQVNLELHQVNIEFRKNEYGLEALQKAITDHAGDYTISPL